MQICLIACYNNQKDYEFEIKTDKSTKTTLSLNLFGAKLPNGKSRFNLHFGKKKASICWKKGKLCTPELRTDENTTFEEYFHVEYNSKHLSLKVKDNLRKYSSSSLTVVFIPCKKCTKCKKYFKS